MRRNNPILITVIGLAVFSIVSLAAEKRGSLDETIRAVDDCMKKAVFSFIFNGSYPPSTTEALKTTCKTHADNLKCMRDGLKNAEPLVKRGLGAFAQTRQRYNKKICANINSDLSRNWVRDMKCLVDKRLTQYKEIDSVFANTLIEIRRHNFNDSALELKYLCCAFITYKNSYLSSLGKECASSRPTVDDLVSSTVSDMNIICEDEDKLNGKICPSIPPLKNISRTFKPGVANGPPAQIVYIISTLGEPDPSLPING